MKHQLILQNLKCGGCAATIRKGLSELEGVSDVEVQVEDSAVSFETTDEHLQAVHDKLSHMGYPASDDPNSMLKQAKSYVSCMVGRLSDDEKSDA